jgi:hypothetical protein
MYFVRPVALFLIPCYTPPMTLQQTMEIPASRRVHFDLPRDIPVGAAKFELTITPFLVWDTVPQKAADEWVNPLYGLCEGSSLTVEKFLAMTHEDRLLEDAIDGRQRLESEKYKK